MFVVSVSLLDDVVAFNSFSSVVLESGVALPLAADSMPAMPAQTKSSTLIVVESALVWKPKTIVAALDAKLTRVSDTVTVGEYGKVPFQTEELGKALKVVGYALAPGR